MRLLVIAEDCPDASVTGNGSTMITAEVIPRLPDDLDVTLAYFDDGRRAVPEAVAQRCARVVALPIRSRRSALALAPFSRLPRATLQRDSAAGRRVIRELAAEQDAVLAHGLHTFAAALALPAWLPLVVQEVDPWSSFWAEKAARTPFPRSLYYRQQAVLAARLERLVSARTAGYLVVSPRDAVGLGERLGRPVTAVRNGVSVAGLGADLNGRSHPPRAATQAPRVGFVGSLNYTPNVTAATHLVTRIWPLVRTACPGARLVLAGRRPVPEVLALAADDIEILADVPDIGTVYRSLDIAVGPPTPGLGTKNTVLEALASGLAVVAHPTAARTLDHAGQLVLAQDDPAFASAIIALIRDDHARAALGEAAQAWAAELPSWADAATTYANALRDAARTGTAGIRTPRN